MMVSPTPKAYRWKEEFSGPPILLIFTSFFETLVTIMGDYVLFAYVENETLFSLVKVLW
jgi:hypothetical protein